MVMDKNWESINFIDAKKILSVAYKNESHFCDVLELNMPLLCEKLFNQQYISHRREFQIKNKGFGKCPTIDLLIQTDKQVIAVEAKCPKERTQYGVYQLLKYLVLAKHANVKIDRFVLLTTELSVYDEMVINEFELPVEIFYISNEKAFQICLEKKQ